MTIASAEQEAARDLERAREDVRGDLMSARHRVSKPLLRQGIVYSGGKAWTGKHELWLRSKHSFRPACLNSANATVSTTMAAAATTIPVPAAEATGVSTAKGSARALLVDHYGFVELAPST